MIPTFSRPAFRAFFVDPSRSRCRPLLLRHHHRPREPPLRFARASKVAEAAPIGLIAPIASPTELQPEEGLDLGGLEVGAVEAGLAGGVSGRRSWRRGRWRDRRASGRDLSPAAGEAGPRVGGVIREPRKVVDVAPVYPEVAMHAGVEGIVIIEATIDARGRVTNATILRGLPMLDEAALEAVRRWVYTPTLLGGVPTPVIMTVTVRFQLKTGASRGTSPR